MLHIFGLCRFYSPCPAENMGNDQPDVAGWTAEALSSVIACRAFARRPVARRQLWAAGRRVMDGQGARPTTARLPSPRLREARTRVRSRSRNKQVQ
jgi:hypothetical protein